MSFYRSSSEVTGYTHSDGYCLCTLHGSDAMPDPGNASGYVQPIFLGDEWDSAPTCDVCNEEIEVTIIGQEEESGEEDDSPETYALLVSNIGWIHQEESDYDKVKRDYDYYVQVSKTEPNSMAGNEQVSLWSSKEDDPIEEYDPPLCPQCHNLLTGACIIESDGGTVHESCWHDYAFTADMSSEEVQEVFDSAERITL